MMAVEQIGTQTTEVRADRERKLLVIERVFDAPRELVWEAWTTPEHLAQWWGPRGWTTENRKLELKPDGVWHYCMRGPEGVESWGKAIYREIEAPSRLVYFDVFSDAEGNTNESMPMMVITTEFEDLGGRTKVLSMTEFASEEQLATVLEMGVVQGVSETWDRLAEFLAER